MSRYTKIKPNDVVNGEGIMVSVWFQGCPHHCKGCFNTDTWDFNKGKEFNVNTMNEVLKLLDKDGVHRNLSILGGEPLCKENISSVIGLTKLVKRLRPNTKVFVWTGYLLEDLLEEYDSINFDAIDVIIDGKFEESLKNITLSMRGSSNQRVIDLSATLKQKKIINYLQK